MAKTYSDRFYEFRKSCVASGVLEVAECGDDGVKIDREVFGKLFESVSDFVIVEEWDERLKPYRYGEYKVSYWKSNNSSGSFAISLE